MSISYKIENLTKTDLPKLVELWNKNIPDEPLSLSRVTEHTFEHKEFDPTGAFIARKDDEIIGFSFASTVVLPEARDIGEDGGFIPAIVVDKEFRKQGIGKALLEKCENYLKEKGKKRFRAGYVTFLRGTIYSLFGIKSTQIETFWFFNHFKYGIIRTLDSAIAELATYNVPQRILDKEKILLEQENISFDILSKGEDEKYLEFLKKHFFGWYKEVKKKYDIGKLLNTHNVIAKKDNEIIGFAGQFDIPDTNDGTLGFGIGVDEKYRNKGLGSIILARSLLAMKNQNAAGCTIFGVGPKKYYDLNGFHLKDLWLFMEKSI